MFEPRISKKYGHKLQDDVVAGFPCQIAREPRNYIFKKNTDTDIVEQNIISIEKKFFAETDFYCIMPDHIHLIIFICSSKVTLQNSSGGVSLPNSEETSLLQKATLGQIIAYFKYQTAKEINILHSSGRVSLPKKLWQPNYYEHIIRNEKALDKIRRYIANNPNAEKYNWDELEK
ncbi:MAG: transposase [Elusimicrobia bacterium]|nr:transposase [Elusimicrobiota bacterium]